MPSSNHQPAGCLPRLLAKLFAASRPHAEPTLPYARKKFLVSAAERAFLAVLEDCLPPNTRVFCQVPLINLLYIPRGTPERQKWHNKYDRKTVDFVLCSADKLQPLLVIELDDKSHQRPDRIERDRFVEQALEAAGLPMARFPARRTHDTHDVRQQIAEHLADPS